MQNNEISPIVCQSTTVLRFPDSSSGSAQVNNASNNAAGVQPPFHPQVQSHSETATAASPSNNSTSSPHVAPTGCTPSPPNPFRTGEVRVTYQGRRLDFLAQTAPSQPGLGNGAAASTPISPTNLDLSSLSDDGSWDEEALEESLAEYSWDKEGGYEEDVPAYHRDEWYQAELAEYRRNGGVLPVYSLAGSTGAAGTSTTHDKSTTHGSLTNHGASTRHVTSTSYSASTSNDTSTSYGTSSTYGTSATNGTSTYTTKTASKKGISEKAISKKKGISQVLQPDADEKIINTIYNMKGGPIRIYIRKVDPAYKDLLPQWPESSNQKWEAEKLKWVKFGKKVLPSQRYQVFSNRKGECYYYYEWETRGR